MHCVLLELETCPASHDRHETPSLVICPSGQEAQVICSAAEVCPAGHDSHEFVAEFSKLPAAQVVHCVLLESETCPSGQETQVVCPAVDISSFAQTSHELVAAL